MYMSATVSDGVELLLISVAIPHWGWSELANTTMAKFTQLMAFALKWYKFGINSIFRAQHECCCVFTNLHQFPRSDCVA